MGANIFGCVGGNVGLSVVRKRLSSARMQGVEKNGRKTNGHRDEIMEGMDRGDQALDWNGDEAKGD